MKRKLINISVILFIILVGVFILFQTGRTYVEGIIEGRLSTTTSSGQLDMHSFFVRAEELGTLGMILKWDSASMDDTEVAMRIFNMKGEEVNVHKSNKTNFSYINVTGLGDKGYLDYKVEVIASKGESDYTLRVIKPGEFIEGNSSNLIGKFAFFNITVPQDQISLESDDWIHLKDLTEGLSNIIVKLFDKNHSRADNHTYRFAEGEVVDLE